MKYRDARREQRIAKKGSQCGLCLEQIRKGDPVVDVLFTMPLENKPLRHVHPDCDRIAAEEYELNADWELFDDSEFRQLLG